MRLTLITLLIAGVAGCDSDRRTRPPQPPVEEPKLENGNSGNDEPESEFEATLKAAEQGDAEAQNDVGVMYNNGWGVSEDYAEAVKWYRKAAEQGHVDAQNNLGLMLDFGYGVPEDDAEAVKWFHKAAEQGFAKAQYNLGTMYVEGEGVPDNDVEAYVWFSVAATNGAEFAKEMLPKAKAKLTPDQLIAAQNRAEELTEQINANKAK